MQIILVFHSIRSMKMVRASSVTVQTQCGIVGVFRFGLEELF